MMQHVHARTMTHMTYYCQKDAQEMHSLTHGCVLHQLGAHFASSRTFLSSSSGTALSSNSRTLRLVLMNSLKFEESAIAKNVYDDRMSHLKIGRDVCDKANSEFDLCLIYFACLLFRQPLRSVYNSVTMRRQGEKAKEAKGGTLKWILIFVVLGLLVWFVFILNYIGTGTLASTLVSVDSGAGSGRGEFTVLDQSSHEQKKPSTGTDTASISKTKAGKSPAASDPSEDVHVVFSTDCSEYQVSLSVFFCLSVYCLPYYVLFVLKRLVLSVC